MEDVVMVDGKRYAAIADWDKASRVQAWKLLAPTARDKNTNTFLERVNAYWALTHGSRESGVGKLREAGASMLRNMLVGATNKDRWRQVNIFVQAQRASKIALANVPARAAAGM